MVRIVSAFVYISQLDTDQDQDSVWHQAATQSVITTSTLCLSQQTTHEGIYAHFLACLAHLSLTVHSIRFRAAYLCRGSVHSMIIYTSWSVPKASQTKHRSCVTGSSQDIDNLQKNGGKSASVTPPRFAAFQR